MADSAGDLKTALKYADQSIQVEDRFDNELTKSKVLTALGRKDDAAAAEKQALALASPLQIHIYARGLQAQKRSDEAYAIFRDNAKKHPDMWFVHSGLARIYCGQGKFDDAAKEMKLALAGVIVGFAASYALMRYVSSFLFGVQPGDPMTLIAVIAVITIAVLAACIVPAKRATRVDPMIALRSE